MCVYVVVQLLSCVQHFVTPRMSLQEIVWSDLSHLPTR